MKTKVTPNVTTCRHTKNEVFFSKPQRISSKTFFAAIHFHLKLSHSMKGQSEIWTLEMNEQQTSVPGIVRIHTLFEFCVCDGGGVTTYAQAIQQHDYRGFGNQGPMIRIAPDILRVPVDLTINGSPDRENTLVFTEAWKAFQVQVQWKVGGMPWSQPPIMNPDDEHTFEMSFRDGATFDWDGTTKNVPRRPQIQAIARSSSFTLKKGPLPQGSTNRCYHISALKVIRQKKRNDCWAVTATMMMSWKRGLFLQVDDFLKSVDAKFGQIYRNDAEISQDDYDAFLARARFKTSPPMSFSMDGVINILTHSGPLTLIIDGTGTDNRPQTHAVVVTGICGDGTDTGTVISYVNPAQGSLSENFGAFRAKYDSAHAGARVRGVHF